MNRPRIHRSKTPFPCRTPFQLSSKYFQHALPITPTTTIGSIVTIVITGIIRVLRRVGVFGFFGFFGVLRIIFVGVVDALVSTGAAGSGGALCVAAVGLVDGCVVGRGCQWFVGYLWRIWEGEVGNYSRRCEEEMETEMEGWEK